MDLFQLRFGLYKVIKKKVVKRFLMLENDLKNVGVLLKL